MWFAFRQRLLSWFGGSGRKVESVSRPEDFRSSEPVLTDSPEMQMGHVGNANMQVGRNSKVHVVHRNVTNIYVLGDQDSRKAANDARCTRPTSDSERPAEARPSLTTAEQREVLAMIRALRKSDSVFAFMEKNFGTRMVMNLHGAELERVKAYVESINRRMQKARREKA